MMGFTCGMTLLHLPRYALRVLAHNLRGYNFIALISLSLLIRCFPSNRLTVLFPLSSVTYQAGASFPRSFSAASAASTFVGHCLGRQLHDQILPWRVPLSSERLYSQSYLFYYQKEHGSPLKFMLHSGAPQKCYTPCT